LIYVYVRTFVVLIVEGKPRTHFNLSGCTSKSFIYQIKH